MLEWVPPPAPPERRLTSAQFKGDPQVAAWKARRGLQPQVHLDPSTLGMSQNALAFILQDIESRRHNSGKLSGALHDAMVEFTPKLSQPHRALAHVFAQPEMQAFWSKWTSTRSRSARARTRQTPARGTGVNDHEKSPLSIAEIPHPGMTRSSAGSAGWWGELVGGEVGELAGR